MSGLEKTFYAACAAVLRRLASIGLGSTVRLTAAARECQRRAAR